VNPPATQPELFTVEAVQGYGCLSRIERTFVQEIVSGANQTQAALKAGFSEGNAAKAGCKLARKGKVLAVLNQAWIRSGASIDDTLRQAAELQQRAYREALEAATAERAAAAFKHWREASTLIASIHGRLELKLSGQVNHNHSGEVTVAVSAAALPVLAQMRRDCLTSTGGQN